MSNHCRADISFTLLEEPITLGTDWGIQYEPLDLNNDNIIDFTFGADVSFVGVHPEESNQYLIYPSPPPNIGGPVEPIPLEFKIGSGSENAELNWYGSTGASTLIVCLNGAGGYTCSGRFKGQRAYVGVKFQVATKTHYGWIDLFVASNSPGAVIYGWGYETEPEVSIIAGAVPEPSTTLLFAIGFMVVIVLRLKNS